MTNDHRESIRDAAERHAQYARWAMMAEADELPHAFEPYTDDDEPVDPDPECQECGDTEEDGDHAPEGFDPDEYADGLAGLLLDATVWRADGDESMTRVELLLACGGPTITVEVDEGDRVTFHHSWGRYENPEDDGTYSDQREFFPYGDDAAVWVEIADYYREAGQ